MSANHKSFATYLASVAIAFAAQSPVSAQAPSPGAYDPNYVQGADNPSLRIPRGGSDLRGPVDNSFVQDPNASMPAPSGNAYGAANGGYPGVNQGGAPGANGYQDPNAVQPYPNKYKKSKKNGSGGGPSGIGMAVGGPAKAATTGVGLTGKAAKEVFKAIF